MEEALRRAEAYRQAGADAILIHSKLSKPDEILDVRARVGRPRAARHRADEVLQHADRRVPPGGHQHGDLGEPPDPRARLPRCRRSRRKSTKARRSSTWKTASRRSTRFSACRMPTNTRRPRACYLSASSAASSAVVLAASRGAGLEAVTDRSSEGHAADRGQAAVALHLVEAFKKEGINDITVVGGYRADAIDTAGIRLVVNEKHEETGELASLACAVEACRRHRDFLRRPAVPQLHPARSGGDRDSDFCVVVDSSQTPQAGEPPQPISPIARRADDRALFGQKVLAEGVGERGVGSRSGTTRRKAAGWAC